MHGELIAAHGYWILAVGCLLEGETVLLLAGFAAHRGYLDPLAVFTIAAVCGFAGDQFYFWLGRRHGAAVLARWPSLARRTGRVTALLARFSAPAIIGVRFAYGLRLAGPILIGMTPIGSLRFAVFNAIGALLWAGVFTALGWLFGSAAQAILGEIRHVEVWLLLGLAAGGLILWLIHFVKQRR
jgi:membrane protein DedA with SNARE-associated domain